MLSEEELEIFDVVEYLLHIDYEEGYRFAIKAVERLRGLRKYKSALYVCEMINDEILRREILKEGMEYYVSVGDFKNAYEFARMLGDERKEIYKMLSQGP